MRFIAIILLSCFPFISPALFANGYLISEKGGHSILIQNELSTQGETELIDPLNDFSLVKEHSQNLSMENGNPGNFNNDSSRVVRSNLQNGYLIYEFDSIADFTIEFWIVDDSSGEIKVYGSEDGTVFNEVQLVKSQSNFGYRDKISYSPSNLQSNVNFLKIEISGGNGSWKGQIGSVHLMNPAEVRTEASVFYIDAENGLDSNPGTSPESAFQSLSKMNEKGFLPGDSIFLKAGQEFFGKLEIIGKGAFDKTLFIGKYGGEEKPVINAAGYLAGIRIADAGNITVSDLEIISDAGEPLENEARTERYGIYASAGTSMEYKNFRFENLSIHHIFATENVDSDGQNPTSNMGMGIYINMENRDAKIKNVHIENCDIFMTGHTGIKIFGSGNWPDVSYLDSVFILNNRLEHIGGPGMVPGRCSNVVVRGNVVNYSGSSADPRMHNRGSGIWPWTCKNVLIEKNEFKHAWGKYDSCGAHIDFNCSNVTIQYNLSYNNAGGFVEILGNNTDCVYRYNVSINDGFRKVGVNGALSDGHIFWISNYVGQNNDPVGATNCSIYNNTIYVGTEIESGIFFAFDTKNNRIENNIIFADGILKYSNMGEYNTFNNNIWYGNIPDLPYGEGALFANPQLINPGDTLPESYQLTEKSPAINTGGVIENRPQTDFWGDSLAESLVVDRGADESEFNPALYSINSTAETEGGRIYPYGTNFFPENADIPFRIVPKPGFIVEEILVDDVPVEDAPEYIFEQLAGNHSIDAQFFAPADSLTDPLNDLSIVSEHSGNIKVQDENPDNFEGDSGRAVRINTNTGSIIYNFKEITDFFVAFWGVNDDSGTFKVYISKDGLNYSEIDTKVVEHSDFGFRYKTVFTSGTQIPEGINYIKFEITGSDAAWKSQIGGVKINWLGDERNATSIRTVEKMQINLYPNPAHSRIFIEGINPEAEVKIVNSEGRFLYTRVNQNYIDISALKPGIYFIMVEDYVAQKFVKK